MKQQLKRLYFNNIRHYEVWNYLWLISEDGITMFQYVDICCKFKVPKSTLSRILQLQNTWNNEKQLTTIEKEGKWHKLTFWEELPASQKKKPTKTEFPARTEQMFDILTEWYKQKEVEYPTLEKDKKRITEFLNRIEKSLTAASQPKTDKDVIEAATLYFNKIPEWWIKNAYSMATINKNYMKIYNQIKLNSNGNSTTKESRIDKYRKAAESSAIDFEKLASGSKRTD